MGYIADNAGEIAKRLKEIQAAEGRLKQNEQLNKKDEKKPDPQQIDMYGFGFNPFT